MSTDVEVNNGIGFLGGLQLIFITLKLIDQINWSWFWVLSPIWIVGSFICFILLGVWVLSQ